MLPQTRRHTQGWLHLELYNNARSHTYSANLYRCINSLPPKPIHSAAPSRERRSRSWGYCNDRHKLFFYLVVSMGVLCLSNVSSVTCFSSMPTIAWTHQSTVHASWGSVPCYQSTTFRNNPYPSKSGTQQLCMYVCMYVCLHISGLVPVIYRYITNYHLFCWGCFFFCQDMRPIAEPWNKKWWCTCTVRT